jgi:hypothetical protein
VLWYIWNVAVLSSIQLTVRLIRAFSVWTTMLGALAFTVGSIPIVLLYRAVLSNDPSWYPVPMALTGLLGYAVGRLVLRLRRQRARVAAAIGTALLSGPWPVFMGAGLPR